MNLTWKMAHVRLYWFADGFSICTCITMKGGKVVQSGYKLLQNRDNIGMFNTLQAAQDEAETRSALCHLNG